MNLQEEKQELLDLLTKNNLSINGRRPFGLIEMCIDLSSEDRLNIHYNSYFSKSLLENDNKWL